MANARAPKQVVLTKSETITSFENWRQNITYIFSLETNFVPFLTATWRPKTAANPNRGLTDDPDTVDEPKRKTAVQKATALELMLGQIANYCPVISRNTIIKKSTSLNSIWQNIREHYQFQLSGARFLDLSEIRLEVGERSEYLFQRLTAFF